ncbi:hypothetical protein GCM10027048_03770 [Hymenobacter coalescens]
MAIWQYRLTALPAAGIRRKLGHIPAQLFIDHEGRKQYWAAPPSPDSLPRPAFEDAYTINWWEDVSIAAAPLAAQIDQLLPRETWVAPTSDYIRWKGDGRRDEDHDCSIAIDAATGTLGNVEFRTDFRNLDKAFAFLSAMLTLSASRDLLVFDAAGALMPPQVAAVLPSVQNSSAVRFLTKPQQFLEQILREQKDR